MTARRVTHAQQRASKGVRHHDSVFDRITIVSSDPLIPVPEVFELDFSPEVFDAIFGPQEGPAWAPTTVDFPELFDARENQVFTRF